MFCAVFFKWLYVIFCLITLWDTSSSSMLIIQAAESCCCFWTTSACLFFIAVSSNSCVLKSFTNSCSVWHIFIRICHTWLMSMSFYLFCQAEQDCVFISDSTCAEYHISVSHSVYSFSLSDKFLNHVSITLTLNHIWDSVR